MKSRETMDPVQYDKDVRAYFGEKTWLNHGITPDFLTDVKHAIGHFMSSNGKDFCIVYPRREGGELPLLPAELHYIEELLPEVQKMCSDLKYAHIHKGVIYLDSKPDTHHRRAHLHEAFPVERHGKLPHVFNSEARRHAAERYFNIPVDSIFNNHPDRGTFLFDLKTAVRRDIEEGKKDYCIVEPYQVAISPDDQARVDTLMPEVKKICPQADHVRIHRGQIIIDTRPRSRHRRIHLDHLSSLISI